MSETIQRPPVPVVEWKWYSICSVHGEFKPECGACNRGRWISENEREFDSWLWTYDQSIWKKWANRNNTSGWREWFRQNMW